MKDSCLERLLMRSNYLLITIGLFVLSNCSCLAADGLPRIDAKPMKFTPCPRGNKSKPNEQVLGPYELWLSEDLDTGCLEIICDTYGSDVEDTRTINIEGVYISSTGTAAKRDKRIIKGKMRQDRPVWISEKTVKDIKLKDTDTIGGDISARVGMQTYIFHEVDRETSVKAHGIDLRVGPCFHYDCYEAWELSEKQRSQVMCISAAIDKSCFENASVKVFLKESEGYLFRHTMEKHELCFNSIIESGSVFPVTISIIKYEPKDMEFAINFDLQLFSRRKAWDTLLKLNAKMTKDDIHRILEKYKWKSYSDEDNEIRIWTEPLGVTSSWVIRLVLEDNKVSAIKYGLTGDINKRPMEAIVWPDKLTTQGGYKSTIDNVLGRILKPEDKKNSKEK